MCERGYCSYSGIHEEQYGFIKLQDSTEAALSYKINSPPQSLSVYSSPSMTCQIRINEYL